MSSKSLWRWLWRIAKLFEPEEENVCSYCGIEKGEEHSAFCHKHGEVE